ncbi:MAG: hypothetical protein IJC19_02905 [Clostridia bacterium]|nr:hypothetical protein [Clostridia bacterium]
MKRIATLPLLLCLILLTACSSAPSEFTQILLAHRDPATDSPTDANGVAVGVSFTTPLSGLEFECALTGEAAEITVSIYKADTDYETTVGAETVREERITNLSAKLLWQFDALPAGDYIILFSNPKNASLIKSVVTSYEGSGKILHYRNGTVMTDGTVALTLLFPTTEGTTPALKTFTYPIMEQ